MFEYIKDLVVGNPVLALVFSGGTIGLFIAYGKTAVSMLSSLFLSLFSFMITHVDTDIRYSNEDLDNFALILKSQKVLFQNTYELKGSGEVGLGYGRSGYLFYGKFTVIDREMSDKVGVPTTTTKIRVYFANKKKFLDRLADELGSAVNLYENKTIVSYNGLKISKSKRCVDSVYTNDGIAERLLEDVKSFIANKAFYDANNILYKRNYLLYGKPGTGKTSLIFALASELNYNVRMLNLKMSASEILFGIHRAEKNTILVFEDIVTDEVDGSKGKVVKCKDMRSSSDGDSGVDMSMVLNMFDGLYTKEGMICFFTTNYYDKLDPAFLRDGRMDVKIELDDLKPDVAMKMVKDFTDLDVEVSGSINPATLQEALISYKTGKLGVDAFKDKIKGECNGSC